MFSMLGIAGLALAMAQQPSMARTDQDGSVLVTATLGHGKTWDDEGSIGSGLSAGGSVEWRFHPRLSAAFRVERLGHERHTSGDFLVFTGRTIFATGEIKYRFASAGVAPYVAGGYGSVVYSGTRTHRRHDPPRRALPDASSRFHRLTACITATTAPRRSDGSTRPGRFRSSAPADGRPSRVQAPTAIPGVGVMPPGAPGLNANL